MSLVECVEMNDGSKYEQIAGIPIVSRKPVCVSALPTSHVNFSSLNTALAESGDKKSGYNALACHNYLLSSKSTSNFIEFSRETKPPDETDSVITSLSFDRSVDNVLEHSIIRSLSTRFLPNHNCNPIFPIYDSDTTLHNNSKNDKRPIETVSTSSTDMASTNRSKMGAAANIRADFVSIRDSASSLSFDNETMSSQEEE